MLDIVSSYQVFFFALTTKKHQLELLIPENNRSMKPSENRDFNDKLYMVKQATILILRNYHYRNVRMPYHAFCDTAH